MPHLLERLDLSTSADVVMGGLVVGGTSWRNHLRYSEFGDLKCVVSLDGDKRCMDLVSVIEDLNLLTQFSEAWGRAGRNRIFFELKDFPSHALVFLSRLNV